MKALTLAELTKRIDGLNSAASKMGEDYQEVGLLCLGHLLAHGDVGPVNRLILGMPKSTRRLAMATWMVTHGALIPNTDQGTRDTMPLKYSKDKKTNIEAATAEKWYESAPERAISDIFDLQVAVKALLNRAKGKKLQIGGIEKPHEAHSMLKMLAVGVGLPDPWAEEDKAAADAAAAAAAEAAAKAAGTGTPGTGKEQGEASNTDKPSQQRETRAVAKGASRKTIRKTARA